ncbi:MAG TPA: DNA adenine methylase [Tepidisphaeraceae bacterium]|nr:DNA adenine methylase [Tepidisphaeraceae bacterium]
MNATTSNLFDLAQPVAPTTRFQGSKQKLLPWLWQHLRPLQFSTSLDAFGGSGSVSYFLKRHAKHVTCNDILVSSALGATALIENDDVRLNSTEVDLLLERQSHLHYDNFIARTFADIYFTADENIWLDTIAQNIPLLGNRFKRAIAYHALFQSAISKRPYNLFHRKNLYMRFAAVDRSFGNKTTWDRPFAEHFRNFVRMTNAAIFKAGPCRASNVDARNVEGEFDLVYIDPPYINRHGVGVDYHGFYHFLEGLADYKNWPAQIDHSSKHRRLIPKPSRWTNKTTIHQAFAELFERYRHSILAVSYRSDGIPSLEELAGMLKQVKKQVAVHTLDRGYKYALSKNGRSSECLLIGT